MLLNSIFEVYSRVDKINRLYQSKHIRFNFLNTQFITFDKAIIVPPYSKRKSLMVREACVVIFKLDTIILLSAPV